jgi:hypothetical protein
MHVVPAQASLFGLGLARPESAKGVVCRVTTSPLPTKPVEHDSRRAA